MTEVQLTDPDSAQKLGKPVGNYITLESEALRRRDPDARLAMSAMIGEEIALSLIHILEIAEESIQEKALPMDETLYYDLSLIHI